MKTPRFPEQPTPPQVITAADVKRVLAEIQVARRAELARSEAEKLVEVPNV